MKRSHPLLAAMWQLVGNPGPVEAGNSFVDIPFACFGYFLILIWPWLEEVALFVRLDREHPSSGHVLSRLDLPHVDEIETLVVNPGSVLQMLCFTKLFAVSSYFLG